MTPDSPLSPGPTPSPVDAADAPADTKARLIDVAESLFATRGVADASLRDITSAAGVNLAAVNYHFGSKTGLLEAILRARGLPLAEEREQQLRAAIDEASPKPPSLRAILRAFVRPVFVLKDRSPHFPRLLARVQMEGLMESLGPVFQELFHQSFLRYSEVLTTALPDLSVEEIRWRLFFTVGTFHFVVCNEETIRSIHGRESLSNADPAERIVAFCEGGFRAPASDGGAL